MRIIPTMTNKEPTYQVVLDALALSPLYPAFLIIFKLDKKKCRVDVEVFHDILQISPRLPNQEFVELPSSDEEIISFIKELGYKGDIESIIEVYTDHMHQPWRTFAAVINRCLSGKTTGLDKIRFSRAQILWGMFYNKNVDYVELLWEDFMFQIGNKNTSAARKENMPYPRFSKAIIQHFISKDKSISMRNRLFMHTVQHDNILGSLNFVSKTDDYQAYGGLIYVDLTNFKMRNSPAYKTFLAYATGAIPPNKARKFKKHASPAKKKTLVEEHAEKPAARRQSVGVQIRDTPGVFVSKKKAPAKAERSKGIELLSEAALLEEAQLKKAIKRSKRETNIHQAGGSSKGAGLESKVLNEPKGKSIDTSEGTGLKPWVLDVSKADASKSEYESWGDSDDDDDDDRQGDDEKTKSHNDKAVDLNKTDDEDEDEFVHTPNDYVPTDDENVDDEEYDRINEEMYSDVNVELKDIELEGEREDDEEMTDAGHVDAEHENVNQEIAGDQVKDVARATVTAAPATQKTSSTKKLFYLIRLCH
ncbi:hypothetical protein Tco_0272152 [Tanacetum coccineum]